MLKNITLSAEEKLILRARQKAMREGKSFNVVFRLWLTHYVEGGSGTDYRSLMKDLNYVSVGKKFTRDEMNER